MAGQQPHLDLEQNWAIPQGPVQDPEVSQGLAPLRPELVLQVTCLIPE